MPQVTNPTAGDVHVNRPLTNFSQKWLANQAMFVADRSVPNLPVAMQSDLYYEFSRADFFRDEAEKRSDGAETAGGGFKLSTTPYFADVWGFHKDVTDRQRANADSPVRRDQSASQFVTQKLLIRKERIFADKFFKTGVWTAPGSDTAPTTKWDDSASDPVTDLRTALRAIHQNTGFQANRILFGKKAWDIFVDNDAVLDRVSGGATTDRPAVVMRRLIAQLLEIDQVEVFNGIYNSGVRSTDADENENMQFIGAEDGVLIYYAPMSLAEEEPTALAQFSWTGYTGATPNGMRIKRFRNEATASDRVEGEMAFDMKVVAADLGFFLPNVDT